MWRMSKRAKNRITYHPYWAEAIRYSKPSSFRLRKWLTSAQNARNISPLSVTMGTRDITRFDLGLQSRSRTILSSCCSTKHREPLIRGPPHIRESLLPGTPHRHQVLTRATAPRRRVYRRSIPSATASQRGQCRVVNFQILPCNGQIKVLQ
jgi:hypothetical protein